MLTIRKELKKLGYQAKLYSHPQEKKLIYKLGTTDKDKTYTFQIADKIDKKYFEISFWSHPRLRFPIKYLKTKRRKINFVQFPVIDKKFLIELKANQVKFFKQKKKLNPKKYSSKQNDRYLKAIHDLKLLKCIP